MHSTLVMGRMGRYTGNLMTWVRPSNNKQIDRAIRYVGLLLKTRGIDVSYRRLAYALFELREKIPDDQSLVLAVVDIFAGK